jgi:protocatechuate 3,4-dioxygenase beta subunit
VTKTPGTLPNTVQEQADVVTAIQTDANALTDSDSEDSEGAEERDAAASAPDAAAKAGKSDWRVVTGVVVDENGERVTWSLTDGPKGQCFVNLRGKPPHRGTVAMLPEEDGSFRCERFEPGARGIAWATFGEDLVSSPVEFALTEEGPHDLDLRLGPGASISGTFVDADGKPLIGTNVKATWQDQRIEEISGVDEQGRFKFGPLLAGEYELSVYGGEKYIYDHTRFKSVGAMVTGQQRTSVRLQFDKRQDIIAGRVTDQAGQPVEGVSVGTRGAIAANTAHRGMPISCAKTDARGRYELPVFAPGEYEVGAASDDYESTTLTAASAGARDVHIVVQPRSRNERIEGRVIHADTGEPITKFSIAFSSAGSPAGTLHSKHFFTIENESGEFRHGHGGNGDIILTIRAPGLGEAEQLIRRSDPSCVTTGLVIRVAPGETLCGIVTDVAGIPVPDAQILNALPRWMNERDLDANQLGTSDSNGAFAIAGLPEQAKSVWVLHDTFPPVEAPVVRGGDWRIVMPAGATVQGTVRVGGAPRVGLGVNLEVGPLAGIETCRLRRSVTTDDDGVYRFTGVPVGEVRITAKALAVGASGSPQSSLTKMAMAAESTVTTVDFEFEEPNASLLAKVLVGGEPGRGRATLRRTAQGTTAFGGGDVIKPDGSIRMKDLVPGSVELKVTLNGPCRREKRIPIELRANQTAETDVRFVPGDAGLEGLVAVGATAPSWLRLSLEVQTALGLERISTDGLRTSDDGVFSLSGLPAGTATLRVEFTTQSAGHRTCDYTLNLEPGMVTRQDVVLGGGGVVLDVVGGAARQRLWAMVYEGALDLPDFASMTINEIERFNREMPPVLTTDRVSGGFDGLDPGTHTVVVIAPGDEIRGEDHILPGLRYGVITVEVKEGADATASVTLR